MKQYFEALFLSYRPRTECSISEFCNTNFTLASNLSADNFKKYSTSMGRHLSPRYGQEILVSGYPVLTAVNWSQHWCGIWVQYQFLSAPKLARKCEMERWLPCGANGRAGSGQCTVTWLPNFLGWVDLFSYGDLLERASRTWSSAMKYC